MTRAASWTPEGAAATDVVLHIFRANGQLLAAGDLLASEDGLTAARWQVMGALALTGQPLTVPQIARRMGLTRQSVQALVDRLVAEGLLEPGRNPDHRRSKLIRLTKLGTDKYTRIQRRQITWINKLTAGLKVSDLATTASVLNEIANRLDPSGRSPTEEI